MNAKRIIIIVLIVAAAAAAYYFLWVKRKIQYEWTTAPVEKGELVVSISATGTINPVTTVLVGTRVSGTITKIYVDFNSNVKKGEVIAELDKTPLITALEDAKANEQKAYVQMQQAKRDYDRNKKLWDEKIVSDMDYYTSQTNYEAAKNTYTSAKAQANTAEINLKYAIIIAPINGTVISRSVDVGQTVASSFSTPTLFSIANDLTKMEVIASVDEADIGQIKMGQTVSFTVDAYPDQSFKGNVQQIRLQPIITANVVTYNVIVAVNNDELKLLPGMTANITIVIDKHEDVLKVPTAALRFRPDSTIFLEFGKNLPDSVKKKVMERYRGGGRWGGGRGEGGRGREGRGGGEGRGSGEGRGGEGRGGAGGRQGPGMRRSFSPGSKATVWLKKGEDIEPARVIVGLSDGSYTEVEGKNIKESDLIILNVKAPDKQKSSQQQSPFMPTPPRGGGGGGGGGRRF